MKFDVLMVCLQHTHLRHLVINEPNVLVYLCPKERVGGGDPNDSVSDSLKRDRLLFLLHFARSSHLQNNRQYSSSLNIHRLVTDVKLPLLSEQTLKEHIDNNSKTNRNYPSI